MAATRTFEEIANRFRNLALSLPETHEDHPWGESAFKVAGKKVFLFMYMDAERLSLSTKLPETSGLALTFPFAQPTGYGLGRSGWVTSVFAPGDAIPESILQAWVKESFLAVAPKKVAARLGGASEVLPVKKAPAATKTSAAQKAPAAKQVPAARKKTAAKKAQPAAKGVADKKAPVAKKTSAAAKGVADKKAPAARNARAANKAPMAAKGAAANKAPAKRASAAKNARAANQAPMAAKGAAAKKAPAAKK